MIRRPFRARAVTLAFFVVLLLCASLLAVDEARADVVGALEAVGGAQPVPAGNGVDTTSEPPSETAPSDQPSSSSQPAPAETGSTPPPLADPAGAVGGAVGGTVGTAQTVLGSAGALTSDAPSGTAERVTEPVGQAVAPVGEAVTPNVQPVVDEVQPVLRPVAEAVEPVVSPVAEIVAPVLEPVKEVTEPVRDPVAGVTDPVVDVVPPESNPPVGNVPQEPGDQETPGGTTKPRYPAGAPPANDGIVVPRDYSGRVASGTPVSDSAVSGPVARRLDGGATLARYAAHANPPAHHAPSAALAAVSGGVGSALADSVMDQQRRGDPWFFEGLREGLGTTVAAVVGSSAFSLAAPLLAIRGAMPRSAFFESAGSAFATGLACCVLLLYSVYRARPKWASSTGAEPSPPLRLITERPG